MDGNNDKESKPRRRAHAGATYTVDQVNVVREILNKKDYYKILGLKRSCSTQDAHKAYKSLSLKVHPDKNSAPRADEAFKMVSKAFQCLSNEESRKIYDRIGSDHEHVYEKSNNGGGGFNYQQQGFDGFFGGDYYGEGHPLGTLILILCFFAMCCTWIVGPPITLPEELPSYAFTMIRSYNSSFTTQKGVNFYMQSANYAELHPPDSPEWLALEELVEGAYNTFLWAECKREIDLLYRVNMRETPHCDALKRFKDVLG